MPERMEAPIRVPANRSQQRWGIDRLGLGAIDPGEEVGLIGRVVEGAYRRFLHGRKSREV